MHRNRSIPFAVLLIVLGVLLLLRNTGAISKDVSVVWIIVLALGVWLLVERLAWGRGRGAGFVGPLVLIAIGGTFFLRDAGALKNDDVLVPMIVIAVGLGFVLAGLPPGRSRGTARHEVPLEGATEASVEMNHGAGRLTIRSHGGPNLLEGSFEDNARVDVRRIGSRAEVELSPRGLSMPWVHGRAFDWTVTLTRQIPVRLELHTGASASEIDLSDLVVPSISLETGASKATITLPRIGRTDLRIEGGATHVRVRVPERVAARIGISGALSSVDVNEARFPKFGDVSRSPDFDQADDRAEISINAAAASVEIA